MLDELGRHAEAQRYYASALKIKPDDPSVLSNLGLSYALAKDLKNAEVDIATRRRLSGRRPAGAAKSCIGGWPPGAHRAEAETIARADLPSEQAAANVASLRQILARQDDIRTPAPPPQVLAAPTDRSQHLINADLNALCTSVTLRKAAVQ